MTRTLADVIFQDRTLFTVPLNELFPPKNENSDMPDRWTGTYKYDKDGIAYVGIVTHRATHNEDVATSANIIHEYPKGTVIKVIVGGSVAQGKYLSDPVVISTRVVENELRYELSTTQGGPIVFMRVDYDTLKKYFPYIMKEPDDDDDEEEVPEVPEDPDPIPTPPSDFKDEPPKIWGYTTDDIEDIQGNANSPIPIMFRAWDDIGISRFYYSLRNEHEIEEVDILKSVSPTKYGDYTYKFDIVHSLTGNYQYKIVAFDTAGQRTDSNTFSVIVEPSLDKPIYSPVPPPVSDSDYIVLYDKKENDFTHNGIGILDNDVIECLVDNKENEAYELTLKYLITGKYVDELLDIENIIKCKANVSDEVAQLFRIYDSEYIMNENVVVVKAQHISYDLKDEFVESINLVGATCEQATQTLMSKAIGKSRFVVESNVSKISNFKQERVNVLEAIAGIERSIFETYGNNDLVISRNNFNYSINKQVDTDSGVVIAYSKNILGLRRTINVNDVITGIYPYAFSRTGACLKLAEKIIYSKNIGKYGTYKIKAIDFTSDSINDEESLRSASSDYFSNGCDIPKINYDIDFVNLYSNSNNREKYKSLEIVKLGQVVTVQDNKIGLSVKARVIRTVYDVLKKRYKKIELGNFKNEYRISRKNEINNLKKVVRNTI